MRLTQIRWWYLQYDSVESQTIQIKSILETAQRYADLPRRFARSRSITSNSQDHHNRILQCMPRPCTIYFGQTSLKVFQGFEFVVLNRRNNPFLAYFVQAAKCIQAFIAEQNIEVLKVAEIEAVQLAHFTKVAQVHLVEIVRTTCSQGYKRLGCREKERQSS